MCLQSGQKLERHEDSHQKQSLIGIRMDEQDIKHDDGFCDIRDLGKQILGWDNDRNVSVGIEITEEIIRNVYYLKPATVYSIPSHPKRTNM